MTRLFGTDGVRGIANTQLTNQIAYRLGQAAVVYLGKSIVVGRDTRLSGDMLEASLVAGITSAGGTAYLAGIIPTPAVALLTRKLSAAGGVVISASHNPPEYNGIKLFDYQGFKLSDAREDEIEAFVREGGLEAQVERAQQAGDTQASMPCGNDLGIAVPLAEAARMYVDHVVDSVRAQGITFDGLRIVLDTAHGAASATSPVALRELGADVTVINDDFDGTDINVNCGSTHMDGLGHRMADAQAHVGIAHDGDADRVMLMTSTGDIIDGDVIAAVCARDMKARGVLTGNTVVSTVMCNLGFMHAMRDADIQVVQTQVGDRYVLEEMRASGSMLGGEQSGHMIFLQHNTTGDGLLTAVQFLAAVKRSGQTVDEAVRIMQRFPQTLINVKVADKNSVLTNVAVQNAVAQAERELGDDGRILLRPSGTEPLIRVMVEASTETAANHHAEAIAKIVQSAAG